MSKFIIFFCLLTISITIISGKSASSGRSLPSRTSSGRTTSSKTSSSNKSTGRTTSYSYGRRSSSNQAKPGSGSYSLGTNTNHSSYNQATLTTFGRTPSQEARVGKGGRANHAGNASTASSTVSPINRTTEAENSTQVNTE